MREKNKEILNNQAKQKRLRKEIQKIKTKLPKLIIGVILFTILMLYAFKDKVYIYFGTVINFLIAGMILLGLACIFFIYKSYRKIKIKEKEITLISKKLYKLMKL